MKRVFATVIPWAVASSLLTGCAESDLVDSGTVTELEEDLSNAKEAIADLEVEVEALSAKVSSLTADVDASSLGEEANPKRVVQVFCFNPPGDEFFDTWHLLFDDGSIEMLKVNEYRWGHSC